MGGIDVLLAAWLVAASGQTGAPHEIGPRLAPADEVVFVAGRVQVQTDGQVGRSRRFEVTLQKRRGRIQKAHACIFADIERDAKWEGSCFALEPLTVESLIGADKFTPELSAVDRSAQHLLRLLAKEGDPHLPEGVRLIGYDPQADFQVSHEKFIEGDL